MIQISNHVLGFCIIFHYMKWRWLKLSFLFYSSSPSRMDFDPVLYHTSLWRIYFYRKANRLNWLFLKRFSSSKDEHFVLLNGTTFQFTSSSHHKQKKSYNSILMENMTTWVIFLVLVACDFWCSVCAVVVERAEKVCRSGTSKKPKHFTYFSVTLFLSKI